MLSEAGWQVDAAPDGRQALGLVDAEPVRGRAVGHRHARHRRRPAPAGDSRARPRRPVLLITGHPRVDTAVEALEHGALRYLQKPVRERDLLSAVENAARLHRMARLKREALAAIGLEDRLPTDRAGLETRFRQRARHAAARLPAHRARGDGTVFGYEALTRTDELSIPNPGALLRGGGAAGPRARGGRRGAGPRGGVPGPRPRR